MDIKSMAEQQREYAIALRREFHEHPELSGQETETRARIVRELEQMDIPYELLPGTGIIARLEGGKPGPCRAVRADIDALPVTESPVNLRQAKQCVSAIPGRMHACGHDAHAAVLLATLHALSPVRSELAGTVLGCFEEGEETNCGIDTMISALEKYPVDEVFGLHVQYRVAAGTINIAPGPRMAGTLGIGVTFRGRSGHGSRPDQAINPIVPAAHFITQLNSAFMNQLDVEKTVTLGLGKVAAGEATNVIPETAYVGGTARFFDRGEGLKAERIVRTVAETTATAFACTVEYEDRHGISPMPVVNDPDVATSVSRALADACGETVLADEPVWYASETFSSYLEHYRGAFAFLGIKNERLGSGAAHHNEKFDIDERALPLGVAAELAFITRP